MALDDDTIQLLFQAITAVGSQRVGLVLAIPPSTLNSAVVGRARSTTNLAVTNAVQLHRAELLSLVASAQGSRSASLRDDARSELRA